MPRPTGSRNSGAAAHPPQPSKRDAYAETATHDAMGSAAGIHQRASFGRVCSGSSMRQPSGTAGSTARLPAMTTRNDSDRSDTDRAAEIVASMGDATMLRSVAAVIVGFVILTFGGIGQNVLLARFGLGAESAAAVRALYIGLGVRGLIAIAAGYVTAKAAPKSPFLHAGILAGIIAFFSLSAIAGLRAGGGIEGPTWYPTAVLVIGSIGVLLGGALRSRGRS